MAVLQALFWVGVNLFKHNVGVDGEGLVTEDLQGLLDQTALLLIQFYMKVGLVTFKRCRS
jgi:hypothetical protein